VPACGRATEDGCHNFGERRGTAAKRERRTLALRTAATPSVQFGLGESRGLLALSWGHATRLKDAATSSSFPPAFPSVGGNACTDVDHLPPPVFVM